MKREDYRELLADISSADFAQDPSPGWAGVATLFGSKLVNRASVPKCAYIAAGVPFDATASSRPGASEGPGAIRHASRVFSSYLDSLGEHEMLDTRTGQAFRYQNPSLCDVGDLHVYPTNIKKTFQALAIETQQLAQSGATLILLGGDHSISFALFSGVMIANKERDSADRIGYIQIDHHFDFGSNSALHGPIYHGSNARRISELPGISPSRIAFIGAGSVTRKDQFEFLIHNGFHVITAAQIRKRGAQESLSELVRDFNRDCDRVYLSIDIDVLNAADAPGTGNVTYGGLDVATLMDVIDQLRMLRLVAIDLVEVAPRYDPSGRTAQVAAQIIFETVYRNAASD